MKNLDWMTILMLWTPLSTALFVIFLFGLGALYLYRVVVTVWFLARLQEGSTKHAVTVALTTTAFWLIDLAGALPDGQHVPFVLVKGFWLIALALFIKPDAKVNPSLAAPAA